MKQNKTSEFSIDQPALDAMLELPPVVPYQPAGRASDGQSPRIETDVNPRATYMQGRLPTGTSDPPHYPIPTHSHTGQPAQEVQPSDSVLDPNWAQSFDAPRSDELAKMHQNGLHHGVIRAAGMMDRIIAARVDGDDRLASILQIAHRDRRARP